MEANPGFRVQGCKAWEKMDPCISFHARPFLVLLYGSFSICWARFGYRLKYGT